MWIISLYIDRYEFGQTSCVVVGAELQTCCHFEVSSCFSLIGVGIGLVQYF